MTNTIEIFRALMSDRASLEEIRNDETVALEIRCAANCLFSFPTGFKLSVKREKDGNEYIEADKNTMIASCNFKIK